MVVLQMSLSGLLLVPGLGVKRRPLPHWLEGRTRLLARWQPLVRVRPSDKL